MSDPEEDDIDNIFDDVTFEPDEEEYFGDQYVLH